MWRNKEKRNQLFILLFFTNTYMSMITKGNHIAIDVYIFMQPSQKIESLPLRDNSIYLSMSVIVLISICLSFYVFSVVSNCLERLGFDPAHYPVTVVGLYPYPLLERVVDDFNLQSFVDFGKFNARTVG